MSKTRSSKGDLFMILLLVFALYLIFSNKEVDVNKFVDSTKDTFNDIKETMSSKEPVIINDRPEIQTGGGGGSSDLLQGPVENIKICNTEPDKYGNCELATSFSINETVYVYWQVPGGAGCCATHGCNFDLFNQTCLQHNWKFLYKPYVDGEEIELNPGDYTCEHITPWNFFSTYFEEKGKHKIQIYQRDCTPRTIGFFEVEVDVL